MPKIEALDQGSSIQRNALNHQAIEDYLKTIYTLAEEESPVSTSRIAEAREVKPSSVTSMLQRLDQLNLVAYEKHYGVTLTTSGEKIALEVIRHHRLLELYLSEALGFGWDEVHEQADLLEHVISEKMEERMAAVLGDPVFDPHGDPIPARDGTIVSRKTRLLTTIAAGETVTVARIPDDDNERLRYLAELGVTPGAELLVTAVSPFEGPIYADIANENVVIGHTLAQTIQVSKV
jgi:DtxR family Mn-dependent transcriptional regulator